MGNLEEYWGHLPSKGKGHIMFRREGRNLRRRKQGDRRRRTKQRQGGWLGEYGKRHWIRGRRGG